MWLYLSRTDIEIERIQCQQEGRDISGLEAEFDRVLSLDLEDPANQPAAEALLDATASRPLSPEKAAAEPSDLPAILAARPAAVPLPAFGLSEAELLDRLEAAWTARCAGCLLGKPIEGWRRARLYPLLKETGQWPLSGYLTAASLPAQVREKYALADGDLRFFSDRVDGMPEDDDTNYTVCGLGILESHGLDFTPASVADFWLARLPILHTCTAERVAYRNLCLGIAPPHSGVKRNPHREWIGAQIRADAWGYAAPGDPERAAAMAWRDACVSHVKNGIYGEMWAAAMIAAAFAAPDLETAVRAGLSQIPTGCRLAEAIESVLEWRELDVDYDTACYRVHELWDENRPHDWCHTIPNAMIVVIALLWGGGDLTSTITKAVQACFDTDCNGATAGSVIGAMRGQAALSDEWTGPIRNRLRTGVDGYQEVEVPALAARTLAVARKGPGDRLR